MNPEHDDLDARAQGRGIDPSLLEHQRHETREQADDLLHQHQRTLKAYAVRAWQDNRQRSGLCIQCGSPLPNAHHVRCDPCRARQAEMARQRRAAQRIAAF